MTRGATLAELRRLAVGLSPDDASVRRLLERIAAEDEPERAARPIAARRRRQRRGWPTVKARPPAHPLDVLLAVLVDDLEEFVHPTHSPGGAGPPPQVHVPARVRLRERSCAPVVAGLLRAGGPWQIARMRVYKGAGLVSLAHFS